VPIKQAFTYNTAMIILQKVSLQRGTQFLLEQADATIQPQKRAAIIGANGCGKSSLFKLLLKELGADHGEVVIPSQWRTAHMAQEVAECQRSALDYILDGDKQFRAVEQAIETATQNDDANSLAHAYTELETIDGYTANSRAEKLLHGLGFTQKDMDKSVNSFSGGWRIRLNLAQALMCPSDLMLLDEPTNHLDIDATLWLEQWLKNYQGTLLFISHDRDFIDAIADQILHIEHQKVFTYTGNYSSFENQRAQRLALQQASYQKQQQRISEITQFVDRFKAKATKAKQAQSRLKELERMEKIAPAHVDSPFNFRFTEADKTSDPLLSIEKGEMGYSTDTATTPILSSVELTLRSDSRIGFLGPNGAGKSTLIKTLVGDLPLIRGEKQESEHIHIGYFAQHQLEYLDLDASALLHIQRCSPKVSEQVIRNFLGSFNFHGDKAVAAIKPFSGGEKARLALALIVWQKPNLLILDEPTNHLDLDMRHALTLALQLYKGALIVISHDRHLLKNTVDQFYLVAQKTVEFFDGTLADYQAWLKNNLAKDQQKDNHENTDQNTTGNSAQEKPLDKKQQRQQEAALREKLKPLRNTIKKIELELTKKQKKLDEIEAQLADADIYTDENKNQLKKLLKQQGEFQSSIQQLETDWEINYEKLEG
jgi:ATP-binding cassette subfamily F protein 3